MKAFSQLIETLAFQPSRKTKLALLAQYFRQTADPDRGYALAAMTDQLELPHASPARLKRLVTERVDPELFRLSYDFVGDLAETIALIWPDPPQAAQGQAQASPSLSEAVKLLETHDKADLDAQIAALLDRLAPAERLALLKLATGHLRIGVSTRMAQMALVQDGPRDIEAITAIWHGMKPPFTALFAWLEGAPPPAPAAAAFRPMMLSTPITREGLDALSVEDFIAEWKWDGIRVQAVVEGESRRLYARSGDDISAAFPDILAAMEWQGALDGELLVRRGEVVAPFSDLQKRLGRKNVSRALLESHPAALRIYDILDWEGADLRAQPLMARRAKLEAIALPSPRFDLSPRLSFRSWEELAAQREAPPAAVIEGVMLKRCDSPYLAGRPRGPWFKWKRDPWVIDAVLLYAQAGHGKRSGFYSDFTFGLWEGDNLLPVGKAYSGFSDEELKALDRFVRKNTLQRFGPVRQLAPELVVEVAFEGLNASSRHRSGVAMRFPRISRIRWDKAARDADQLSSLKALL